jgi:signal peptidase II
MMTRVGIRLMLLIAISATIGCDRVTKHIAATTLSGEPRQSFLADTFRLEYAENTGAFLSLGADWPPRTRTALFGIGNAIVLVVLAVLALRMRPSMPTRLGVTLFIAGGASNVLDRIASGKVIDFMSVGLGPVRTGIFNVADVAIMLGTGIVVVASWLTSPDTDPRYRRDV